MQFVSRSSSSGPDNVLSREQIEALHRRGSAPENEVPGAVAFSGAVARTDHVAVAIVGLFAYSTGLAFILETRLRRSPRRGEEYWRGPFRGDGPLFGVEFSDGRRASTLDHGRFPRFDTPEQTPLLIQGGGGGGGRSYRHEYWLSPFPPPGDLVCVVAWPTLDLGDQRVTIAGAALAAARAEVLELWPWEPDSAEQDVEPALPPRPETGWFAAGPDDA